MPNEIGAIGNFIVDIQNSSGGLSHYLPSLWMGIWSMDRAHKCSRYPRRDLRCIKTSEKSAQNRGADIIAKGTGKEFLQPRCLLVG